MAAAAALSGFADHFSRVATQYRGSRPRYPAALAAWLADSAPARGLAWEAGCGSGQFTGRLAEAFARVRATDASAEQLAQAPSLPGVEYAVARAEDSGLPDCCADLICAAQAAHWFDLPAWYAEARRVARPGAVLAAICYGRCTVSARLDELIFAFHDGDAGPYWPLGRAQVEGHYRHLPFPFAELEAPAFEIREEWDCEAFLAYAATWSATQRLIAAGGGAAFDSFGARLRAAWGEPSERRAVRWPLHLRATRLG